MGVMQDTGRLIVTPHPVLLDGQTNQPAELLPGETLYAFLNRHVDLSEQWEVSIGGTVIEAEYWTRIYPKHGQVIEVRAAVGRQAVYLVAMLALAYFTMGIGTAVAGTTAGAALGFTGAALGVANAAIFVAGSLLINKVLGPKPPKAIDQTRDSVYAIGSARNGIRPYEPIGLLLGSTRITPDYASQPYTWYEGDDMYLAMVLNVGINVHDVGPIYNGDTLLSSYEGVQVYYNGIPGKPNQALPLYSNADTIQGGELQKNGTWVERATPADTVRIQINLEYMLGGVGTSGKPYTVNEGVEVQYRTVGATGWNVLLSRHFSNRELDPRRATLSADVPRGHYEVRVRMLGQSNYEGPNTHFNDFNFTSMVAVQADDATYAGIGRIGIRVKATGQLSGAMDQLRMDALSRPVPLWTGTAWVTQSTSNPGAHILAWARGIEDENGKLIAGLGLTDDEIDIAGLQAFMVHCAAEGYTYDHYLRETRSNADQLDAMALAGFGAISWESGKLGVVWAADGQPLSGVVNMATIRKGQFQVDYTLVNAADGIEYTYLDRTDWSVRTLRVVTPGVTTMLNPATVQAEGVTTEAHAAQLARWHLAQSLYQYKDISYATDLEHLSYKRMDVLALQHDLTQWGYGGRLVAVDGNTVTLDEPVPAGSAAHIGIRVPGENVYRVIPVVSFTGETDTLTLSGGWPSDAPLPGAGNPAHDYIWVYDFKSTPGYRVRVVGKELESDAKGARVTVVPESPEFWTYVKTGEYTPATGGSLLNTLPKASNLRVSEVQVPQGNTVYTELSLLWDVTGPAARSVVFAGLAGGELRPVAETVTNQARFRIGQAGTWNILVRPYSPDGIPGESASGSYNTVGTEIPPPPFDWFTVTVEPGGLRRYAWGYSVIQPINLAGAEIRYTAGYVAAPDWDSMTPLGADGFYTAAFESDLPAAGEWTFAIRAINTDGELSAMVVATQVLASNLGETVGGIETSVAEAHAAIQQEILDRINSADALAASAQAQADALWAQVNDITGQADDWLLENEYPAGDLVKTAGKLYRAVQDVPADTPIADTAFWQLIGNYSSLGEAVGANSSSIVLHDQRITNVEGVNTTQASQISAITAEVAGKASSSALNALESRVTSAEGVNTSQASALTALDSRVTNAEGVNTAQAGAISSLDSRTTNVEGVASANSSAITAINATLPNKANVSAVQALEASITGGGNLLTNAELRTNANGWSWWYAPGGGGLALYRQGPGDGGVPDNIPALIAIAGTTAAVEPRLLQNDIKPAVVPGKRYIFSAYVSGAAAQTYIQFLDVNNNAVSGAIASTQFVAGGGKTLDTYARAYHSAVAPANAAKVVFGLLFYSATSGTTFLRAIRPMVEEAANSNVTTPSPWNAGASEFYAAHTLKLDVNGYVSGTSSYNNGETSSFDILADAFRIIKPGGGARTEYSDGNWRVYDPSGVLRVRMGVW